MGAAIALIEEIYSKRRLRKGAARRLLRTGRDCPVGEGRGGGRGETNSKLESELSGPQREGESSEVEEERTRDLLVPSLVQISL
eukprot:3940438-Rhodomonas_salina.4